MCRTLGWLSGLLLACCVVVGCRGGSSDMPVTVTGITPAAAPEGSAVMFSATVTGGTPPYTYAWTFTDVGTPTSSTSATPSVLITGDLGTETVSLVVTDSLSEVGFGSLPFDITDDGVTAVAPSEAGLPLGIATFEATITGTPDSLAWDFGDGAEPSTSTDTEPDVVLQNPGTYSGTVTATFGGVAAPAFPFDFTVAEPVRPAWTIMRIGNATTQAGGINLIEHEGRLTAVYSNGGQLMCTRAKVESPTLDADWDTHVIDLGAIIGHHNVTSIDGRLAVVYLMEALPSGSLLKFAISTVDVPVSASDWISYELGVEFSAVPALGLTMAAVDDTHLVMAFGALSGSSGMRIAVSDRAHPEEPANWETTYLLDKAGVGGFFWPELAVRGADILLAVQEGTGGISQSVCRLLRTTERSPASGTDWELLDWLPNSQFGSEGAHDLQLIGGKPWVVMGAGSPEPQPREIRLFFSALETPATQDDWVRIFPYQLLRTPIFPVAIPEVEGRPAIAVPNYEDQTLRVVRCALVDHTEVSSWIEMPVLNYGTTGGGICSAVAYNDRIAIAVLTDVGAKVAIAQGPF